MKTKVFLVRHGETTWNKLGKFQGVKDIELSEKGIEQAKFLSKRFETNFDVICTSPLKRARKTAEIIAANKNISPIVVQNLREIDFGNWEGLTIKELLSKYSKDYENWKADENTGALSGSDKSLKCASLRAKDAIMEIVKKNNGKTIVIVAHGGIIKASLIALFNWKIKMYHRLFIGNTGVTEVDFDENFVPYLSYYNDTSHLPKEYTALSVPL